MQDVGKLLLLDNGGYGAWSPAKITRDTSAAFVAEREELGFDHATVGAVAILSWNIPSPVAQVVMMHHQLPQALKQGGDVARMVCMLHASKKLLGAMDQCDGRIDRNMADWLASETVFQYCHLGALDLINLSDLIVEQEPPGRPNMVAKARRDRVRGRGYRVPRVRMF
jgi:hypothetical protein